LGEEVLVNESEILKSPQMENYLLLLLQGFKELFDLLVNMELLDFRPQLLSFDVQQLELEHILRNGLVALNALKRHDALKCINDLLVDLNVLHSLQIGLLDVFANTIEPSAGLVELLLYSFVDVDVLVCCFSLGTFQTVEHLDMVARAILAGTHVDDCLDSLGVTLFASANGGVSCPFNVLVDSRFFLFH